MIGTPLHIHEQKPLPGASRWLSYSGLSAVSVKHPVAVARDADDIDAEFINKLLCRPGVAAVAAVTVTDEAGEQASVCYHRRAFLVDFDQDGRRCSCFLRRHD